MATSRSKTRSIIKDELINFNSFQDSQLNTLNSIAKSLDSTLSSSMQVRDSLASMMEAMNSMTRTSNNLSRQVNDRLTSITDSMKSMTERAEKSSLDRIKLQEQLNKKQIGLQDNLSKSGNALSEVVNKLGTKFKELGKVVADTSNRYSQLSNELIKVSGASASDVRDTRSEMVHSIISELNKETGNFYNAEASYSKMIELASSAGIGNLEALEEITRPMLLATETLNTNNGELATLLNRWYTRYNFSSHDMEDVLDDIKSNTAGNNATAEEVQQNISKFTNVMGTYANNTEEFKAMTAAITEETTRLASAGINSGYAMDLAYKIASGELPDSALVNILQSSGSGLNYTSAQNLMRSGDEESMSKALSAISDGLINIASKYKNNTFAAGFYNEIGLDSETMFDYSSVGNALMTSDEFEESTKNNTDTMIDAVDGKFNTVTDQLKNILNSVSEFFSKWQEKTGIAWTDIISLGTGIYTILSLRGVQSALTGGGSGGLGGAGGTGALGNLGTKFLNSNFMAGQYVNTTMAGEAMGLSGTAATAAGAALTVGGVAAGGALMYDGFKGLVDEGSSKTSKALSGVELGAGFGGAAALIALGATNPVGWVAMAVGGIAFLGKKAYENATALSGNAEQVASEIEDIKDSMHKENSDRLEQISQLNYQFSQETDINEQRRLLEESGLFKTEDIQGKNSEALQEMINSYLEASKSLDTITNSVLEYTKKFEEERQHGQQVDFVGDLKNVTSNEERMSTLDFLLKNGDIKDEKLIKYINKYMKDDKITDAEWNDILYGGKNSWFDTHNITDQAISVDSMNLISGLLGTGKSYSNSDNTYAAEALYEKLTKAALFSKEEFDEVVKEIESSDEDVQSAFHEIYDQEGKDIISIIRKSKGYAVGTDYINSNQLAYLHEGESVVPKKYNPSANLTELEMLRDYYQNSTNQKDEALTTSIQEFKETLVEIKEFLAYWRDDNIKRDSVKTRNQKFSNSAASYVARYMT